MAKLGQAVIEKTVSGIHVETLDTYNVEMIHLILKKTSAFGHMNCTITFRYFSSYTIQE